MISYVQKRLMTVDLLLWGTNSITECIAREVGELSFCPFLCMSAIRIQTLYTSLIKNDLQ